MKQKNQRTIISTGTTSIVLTFVLLCLMTFSVLSLVSARTNLRLSERSAERTTQYYTAENAANDILIRVNSVLEDQLTLSVNEGDYYERVRDEVEQTDGISFTDPSHLTYQVPVGEEQNLTVSLALSYRAYPNGRHYQIITWSTGSSHEWDNNENLPVLQGGMLPDSMLEE